MKRCHVCGSQNDDLSSTCAECEIGASTIDKCVPAYVPIDGYISLDQLGHLAAKIPGSSMNEKKQGGPTISWFMISMNLVKWMGIAVICLTMMLLTIMVMKAFM